MKCTLHANALVSLSLSLWDVREQRILKLINEQQKDIKLGKGLTPNQLFCSSF